MTLHAITGGGGGIEAALGAGLQEYSRPEDLNPEINLGVNDFDKPGFKTWHFRRVMNFEPSGGSRVAAALKALEDGETEAMASIDRELRDVGIVLRLEVTALREGRSIINQVSVDLRDDGKSIFEVCGINK